jgi:hypothetical protein
MNGIFLLTATDLFIVMDFKRIKLDPFALTKALQGF